MSSIITGATDVGSRVVGNTIELADNTLNTVGNVATGAVDTAVDLGENVLDKTTSIVENVFQPEKLLKSPILYGILAIFLTMYGPRLHPKLPVPVRNLFNNNYFIGVF